MEYWVLGSDNSAKGPYPAHRVRSAWQEGSLPRDLRICAVGSTEWTTAELEWRRPDAGHGWRPMSYLWPVLVCLACCPFGLVAGLAALLFAALANGAAARGEMGRAMRSAVISKWLVIAAMVGGVCCGCGSYFAAYLWKV